MVPEAKTKMADTKAAELTELVRSTFGAGDTGVEFRPCAVYTKSLDTLTIQWRDCSYVVEVIPGSPNVSQLRNNYGEKGIVGIEIAGWSHFAKDL